MITSLFSFLLLAFHPVHVSVAEIEHNADSKTLEVTQRIFLDDMEKYFQIVQNNNELNITKPSFDLDSELKKYLISNFKVTVGGKSKKLDYLGYEIEGDLIFCYFEFQNIKKLKLITFENTILLETFNDQTNLLHLDYKEDIKSLKFTQNTQKGTLDFTAH